MTDEDKRQTVANLIKHFLCDKLHLSNISAKTARVAFKVTNDLVQFRNV
jgi:hypothetical protein